MNGARKSHSFLTEAVLPAQSKPGIRVLVAGTENILDNLYFGALQLPLPLLAPLKIPCPFYSHHTCLWARWLYRTSALAASLLSHTYEGLAAYFLSVQLHGSIWHQQVCSRASASACWPPGYLQLR